MPYIGQKPADIIATAVDTTTGTFSGDIDASTVNATGDTAAGDNAAIGFTSAEGLILTGQGSTNDVTIKNDADADVIEIPTGTVNVTMAGTLAVAGVVTANAGVKVDNITIDGTEIDLSSGDLTLDIASDLIIDVDDGRIFLKDGGTTFGRIANSSSDLEIVSVVADKDILFKGNDGGNEITALTFDMSEGGRASLNAGASLDISGILIYSTLGSGAKAIQTTASGSHSYSAGFFRNSSGTKVGEIVVGTSATQFLTSSDYRLKENVSYSFDATSRLKQLKPARFNFIADADTTVDGFIAHEVSSIVPEAITGAKDATESMTNVVLNADGTRLTDDVTQEKWVAGKLSTTDEDGNTVDPIYASNTTWVANKTVPSYQGIDQAKLVPLLTKALQEQQATIEALTARIVTLENA